MRAVTEAFHGCVMFEMESRPRPVLVWSRSVRADEGCPMVHARALGCSSDCQETPLQGVQPSLLRDALKQGESRLLLQARGKLRGAGAPWDFSSFPRWVSCRKPHGRAGCWLRRGQPAPRESLASALSCLLQEKPPVPLTHMKLLPSPGAAGAALPLLTPLLPQLHQQLQPCSPGC